ncbi:hypothetical protein ENSA5_46260 [Enhygromyxa salina]|uniref:Lipoprotein n=1 Tax=Enhygromyxa salina TaxID=215803 RepID=A0A2S9XJB4_9BACT|nr:hypothetical protein [Enhygromyxa salina]PRP92958.1 hypothetical protein ENSA5_46260 [Enhygromyxa salina]
MTTLRALIALSCCLGVLACARAPAAAAPEPSAEAAPALMPIEAVSADATAPEARPDTAAEQLLGVAAEDPAVERLFDGAPPEESLFADGARYLGSKARGVELLIERGRISTVFLHGQGHQGYTDYAGAMPGGVAFGDSPDRARALLGEPDAQGARWDKWYRPTWSVHLEYGDSGGVILVTLMTAESDPHR